MRLTIALFCLILAALPARAAECEYTTSTIGDAFAQQTKEFFDCLVDEIERLKSRQRQLEKKVARYERVLSQIPAPYVNDNGKVRSSPNRKIESAKFLLNARQLGGAASLPLDQTVLERLCARQGCQLSMTLRVTNLLNSETRETETIGPCRFDYAPADGDWVRAEGCAGAAVNGTDGNAQVRAGDNGAEVILNIDNTCLLADADLRTAFGSDTGLFGRDTGLGLVLVADSDARPTGARRFTCELEIE